MTLHNKILPVALVAALLGGTVGALVMRHNNASETQVASANLTPANPQTAATTDAAQVRDDSTPAATNTDAQNTPVATDQTAYRSGFTDGFDAARGGSTNAVTRERIATRAVPERVVYRGSRRAVARTNSRTAYYDYAPRQRSFWQKHRDKLTLAMGTGGGALLGGIIGGHKGAAIGALAGGGGSALYTYKLRKRNRRY